MWDICKIHQYINQMGNYDVEETSLPSVTAAPFLPCKPVLSSCGPESYLRIAKYGILKTKASYGHLSSYINPFRVIVA